MFQNLVKIGMLVWGKLIQKLHQKGVYEESFSRHAAWIGGKLIQLMHTTMVHVQVKTQKIQAGVQVSRQIKKTTEPPYPFDYPMRRLTMEEILAKFIDEGRREHKEMKIFIKEFRTTNELLLKTQSNLLSELKIKVNELSKVVSNVLIPKNKVKGVTTKGGKMTSEATHSKKNNETGINKNEPPRFEQDVQEKPHVDCVENKSSSIHEKTTQPLNPHMEVLTEREIADKFSDEHLMVLKSKFNNDEPWTAYKTPTGYTPFILVYGKACHLPVEIEHKAHWALKQCNKDLTFASESRLMQLNELAELRDGAYENTRI
ncbi:hypothetical protein Tco_1195722 [Tanacetum coccineum]